MLARRVVRVEGVHLVDGAPTMFCLHLTPEDEGAATSEAERDGGIAIAMPKLRIFRPLCSDARIPAIGDGLEISVRFPGEPPPAGQATAEWRLARLLIECRDALPAIRKHQLRTHDISPTLADRIDEALKPWEVSDVTPGAI